MQKGKMDWMWKMALMGVLGLALAMFGQPLNVMAQDDDHHGAEVEFRGAIQALTQNSLTVSGTEIFVDSNTIIRGHDDQNLAFSDLQVGQVVEVKARQQADGTYLAVKIELKTSDSGGDHGDEHGHRKWEFEGQITALGANSLTVNGIEIFVNDTTYVEAHGHQPMSFADLAVGQWVEVKAVKRADGSFWARKIEVKLQGEHGEVETKGIIEAIGTDELTVSGLTFKVDATTVIEAEEHAPLSFADLQVGQRVEVKGRRLADGTLLALKIELKGDHGWHNHFEVQGSIEALTDGSVTVSGITFAVDATTRIEGEHHTALTLADLTTGMLVKVKAVMQPDSSYSAIEIKVKSGNQETHFEITGKVDSVGADWISVLGTIFYTDDLTEIENANGDPIRLDAINPGETVEVEATYAPDGRPLARKIKVKELVAMHIEVSGEVTEVDTVAGILVVHEMQFTIGTNTRIYLADGDTLRFQDLRPGMKVEVYAERQADGSLLALRISVHMGDPFDTKIKGSISEIQGPDSTIVVAGFAIRVNAATSILDQHLREIGFGDLQVGQIVEVKAITLPDSSLLAVRIKVEEGLDGSTEMGGELTSVGASSIVVAGAELQVSPNTVVVNDAYQPISTSDLQVGETVYVWAETQTDGTLLASQIQTLSSSSTVSSVSQGGPSTAPASFVLHQNYPNPFNPSTTIRFEIPTKAGPQMVELTVFNLMGQKVRTLVSRELVPGRYSVSWDGLDDQGRQVAAGIYLYKMKAGSQVSMRRMVLVK